MPNKYTNRLAEETSPYLQQHAHNPVDWYPWGEEAFEKARKENKPIIVSIGYSTCHWCHVMERESFENEDIAAIMNDNFINIKVDREERPDVDAIYMDAVQIMTGSGGWPLNCFLLPDGRPFYGGTYFPPYPAHNRPSWGQVLHNLSNAFRTKRKVVEDQAEKLTNYVKNADKTFFSDTFSDLQPNQIFDFNLAQDIYYGLRERFDTVEGGFGNAPKFPSTMALQYCLNYYYFTKNKEALQQVELSLDKMIQGGIYDQIGGGFARYSTDREWLAPHFEKMLYDNALLVELLSGAYLITQKELYKETIEETLDYIQREMMSKEGGFYSAQDADSEGVEGKYYVWEKAEIDKILGKQAPLFNAFYDVTESGNWEEVNILRRLVAYEEFAKTHNISVQELKTILQSCREKLFEIRDKRIKPSLDDKILLNWNALMNKAFTKAYTATGQVHYLKIAERNMDFLIKTFFEKETTTLFHTYKGGKRQYEGFLDDYAYIINALLALFEVTQKEDYLTKAEALTEKVLSKFFDETGKVFYFTAAEQKDLIVRRKDLYDSSIPSGNSTMVENLQRMCILLGKEAYKEVALGMVKQVLEAVKKYPTSFPNWANTILAMIYPYHEIAIIGEDALTKNTLIQQMYIPFKVTMTAHIPPVEGYPLLAGKKGGKETKIYVCKDFTCKIPVETIEAFKMQLN